MDLFSLRMLVLIKVHDARPENEHSLSRSRFEGIVILQIFSCRVKKWKLFLNEGKLNRNVALALNGRKFDYGPFPINKDAKYLVLQMSSIQWPKVL
jgi:hypothetical protein